MGHVSSGLVAWQETNWVRSMFVAQQDGEPTARRPELEMEKEEEDRAIVIVAIVKDGDTREYCVCIGASYQVKAIPRIMLSRNDVAHHVRTNGKVPGHGFVLG